jgi:hypothetical protein
MARDDWRCSVNASRDCSAVIMRGCTRLGHADYAAIAQLAACRSHNPEGREFDIHSPHVRTKAGVWNPPRSPAEVRPPASEAARIGGGAGGWAGLPCGQVDAMSRRRRWPLLCLACSDLHATWPERKTPRAERTLPAARFACLVAPGSIPGLGARPLSACQRRCTRCDRQMPRRYRRCHHNRQHAAHQTPTQCVAVVFVRKLGYR